MILGRKIYPVAEEEMIARVELNPETSAREIARDVKISAPLVWRVLYKQKLYSYHMLIEYKPQIHLVIKHDHNFADNILFTDDFIVGGDGKIYEGAGWHKVGAHTRGYNSRSMGLAFIGNFSDKRPNDKQLKAAKDFLQCAVELGELDENYKLFGARQVSATASPGTRLYNEIKNWPNYSSSP
ncbi:hypothetical protein NQ318_008313 [Aromia moschata]|uniref:Peptidoglycan recognition protein family domain-containing protein n=1 Tax=Aromia moschata TaxID=1265417 RepID=A0AAV8X041_9CUCU|nr:hypothetical protein NQ318_008313 [Aromia moschata]